MPYEAMVREVSTMSYDEQINLLSVLMEALKSRVSSLQSQISQKKMDYTDSYPKGYFDLFGSINDPSFVEPEELSWELESKKEFF